MSVRILIGDCRERMRELPDASVDSVVCDPPYHLTNRTVDVKGCKDCGRTLGGSDGKPTVCPRCGGMLSYQRSQQGKGFMGQTWDGGDVAFDPATWEAVYRVLKPGAHLVAFSGTRTYHRMACAIEDAGFEIRDQLAWVYGSGFPKSLDVSKAIDRAAGAEREVVGFKVEPNGRCRITEGRTQSGEKSWASEAGFVDRPEKRQVTAPATEAAQQWQGWGTALKPSQEPVCLAQKPYTFEQEWVTIRHLIERLWSALWLTLPANDAAQFSTLSPSACGVDPSAFAQWIAEQRCNTLAALSGLTDTSPLGSALITSLNTVSSWNDTLAASCLAASTSTTGTGSSATTDLRTLRFCLSQITPASIIQAHKSGRWSNADACNAARLFNASVAMLSATLELSAVESATDWEAIDCPDAGAPKPNWEPICLARKPLVGTVAANVQTHGTGALNIDGCRIGMSDEDADFIRKTARPNTAGQAHEGSVMNRPGAPTVNVHAAGRWPANIIHDGSDEVLAGFPAETGKSAGGFKAGSTGAFGKGGIYGSASGEKAERGGTGFGDSGSAARFFYCAKTTTEERGEGNNHPTVKPIDLMRWLCRLVTPKGGTVLDPFTGSGSTLIAADAEQFDAIGCELSPDYAAIAERRVRSAAGLFAQVKAA